MKARLATYRDGKLQETYPLPEPGTTIGRDEENHICLDHVLVSRRHAAIKAKDDMWVIKDLDSTNGIEVNGASVKYAVLKNADVIVIGPEKEYDHIVRNAQLSTLPTAVTLFGALVYLVYMLFR